MKKKTKSPSEDVFEGPGFKMTRRGRYLELNTHRSPEEQRELNRRMQESRPKILAEIEHKTAEVREIIKKYTSLDLVANLLLREVSHDPDKYVESETKLRPHWVEHATVLQLMEPKFELRAPVLVDAADAERAYKLLEDIFMQTTWYYLAEAGDPNRVGPPSRMEELRFATLLHGMSVRSPAYSSHWRDALVGLFNRGGGIDWLSSAHELDINSAIAIVDGIETYITGSLQRRFEQARNTLKDFNKRLAEYKATVVFEGEAHEKEVFDRVRNMRGKHAKQYLKYVLVEWIRVALGMVLSFTSEQIAQISGISMERVQAFLDETSLEFGISPKDILPSPVNVLHERPIVQYDNKYFCSVPHLLPWAIKPACERVLSAGSHWDAYQKHRSSYLVNTAIKYLASMLPSAITHEGLVYPLETGKETELDGLVLFDRYTFLIEGKAGSLGKARRGGKEKIKTQLEALVGDAADQVVRADHYIRETSAPRFRLQDGEELVIDKSRYSERILITVTLDVLDIFTADMHQMRDIGVVKTHDLPWCVALTDLRVISDVIVRPYEFTHYLRWRISTIADQQIHGGKDELNWLAVYLKEGPERPNVPAGFTDLTFTSYTDDFDAYFLYKEEYKTTPAPRPSQLLPTPLDTLCDRMMMDGTHGFTAICEGLLDFSFRERTEIAHELAEFAFKEKRGRTEEFLFNGKFGVLKVKSSNLSIGDLNDEASSLNKEYQKRALVISLTSLPVWHVVGWSIAP